MPTQRVSRTRSPQDSSADTPRIPRSRGAAGLVSSNRRGLSLAGTPRDRKLTHIVHEKILRAIIYGRLDFGEPLSENDLAKALGVSKAPVRESLNELRLEGLVLVIPQSGSYVFSPTGEQIEDLCDFRSMLETHALQISMQTSARPLLSDLRHCLNEMKRNTRSDDLFRHERLDTDFHQAIIRHSANSYLVQSYARIIHTLEAIRHRFMDAVICRSDALDEHCEIVNQLAAENVGAATDVLEFHIARTKNFNVDLPWSSGRLRRKDYRFRDYSEIFADA